MYNKAEIKLTFDLSCFAVDYYQIFKRAIAFHKKRNPSSELLQSLIRKSAQYFLRLGKQQEAAALLQEQRKVDPHNAKLLAQLVAAYATFDPAKARE